MEKPTKATVISDATNYITRLSNTTTDTSMIARTVRLAEK